MPQEKKRKGTAREKRNCWKRGNGAYSYRGELKRSLSLNRKRLNRMVRHKAETVFRGNGYRKICRTNYMAEFT